MTDWASPENADAAFDILIVSEIIVVLIVIASAIFVSVFWRKQKAKHEGKAEDRTDHTSIQS